MSPIPGVGGFGDLIIDTGLRRNVRAPSRKGSPGQHRENEQRRERQWVTRAGQRDQQGYQEEQGDQWCTRTEESKHDALQATRESASLNTAERVVLLTVVIGVVGVALLVFGADLFVKGAAGLADALGVAPLVIGLTVVAYGTSMPELVVSGIAAFDGRSGIALGNVIGSNIANIGLILGVTALVSPPTVEGSLIKREVPMFVLSALALPVVLYNGLISRLDAILLLAGAVAFTAATVHYARRAGKADLLVSETLQEVSEQVPDASTPKLLLLIVVGLAMLLLGGDWFVGSAATIATAAGVSERVIGLTVVALGTSLPELAASLVAALRGHSAMAVGNVIGSNIFNVFLVLGAAGTVFPIAGDFAVLWPDLALMLGFTAFAVFSLRGARVVSRLEGAILVIGYLLAIVWLGRSLA